VDGLLKGLKMTEEKYMTADGQTLDNLLTHIKEQQVMISRLIKLHERTMGVVESHQDRITRLEYMLANNKAKRVSRNPGDRES
jgi:hypothetical protein